MLHVRTCCHNNNSYWTISVPDVRALTATCAARGYTVAMAPREIRLEAWRRIGQDLDHGKLTALSTLMPFDAIVNAAHDIVAGKVRGRLVIEM